MTIIITLITMDTRMCGNRLQASLVDQLILSSGGVRGVMVIVLGNEHGNTSSNPGPDCISHSTNTLGKGMNLIILPPAMSK